MEMGGTEGGLIHRSCNASAFLSELKVICQILSRGGSDICFGRKTLTVISF